MLAFLSIVSPFTKLTKTFTEPTGALRVLRTEEGVPDGMTVLILLRDRPYLFAVDTEPLDHAVVLPQANALTHLNSSGFL